MVTMQDVANYAGVSKASVSRVLNGRRASDEIYAKVSTAMQSLGYHPNLIARALTTKRNAVVGVIICENLTQDGVITEFLSQLLEKMSVLKKPLIVLKTSADADSVSECYLSLVEQRCEGIIYISVTENSHFTSSWLDEVNESENIPMVVVKSSPLTSEAFSPVSVSLPLISAELYSATNNVRPQYVSIDESITQTLSYLN